VPSEFDPALTLALRSALSYLDALNDAPVAPTASLETLRFRLAQPLPAGGAAPDDVIAGLLRDVEGGLMQCAGPRFFGWVIGGAVPAALAADWLTATWDQNAATYTASPAAAVVEEVAGDWLKEILGIPAGASFAIVTGCQMAHFTCLAAARHALLERRGWDVEQRGLFGAPAIRVLTSTERHGTAERAVRYLGLGLDSIVDLPVDPDGRLLPEALASALDRYPESSSIVLLQAGDLNIGAFDDFATLIPLARLRDAWVHVDGAFGLWAAASPRYRHLLAGAEHADSWATDGHKWLNVPYDSGYAFVAHPDAHRAAMAHRAPYIQVVDQGRDQMDWTPEWSRRARGFATYAALRQLGRAGISAIVERCCEQARALVLGIGALPGAEVLWIPTLNQGLVRFGDDARTEEVVARIVASGIAFFGATTWRGKRAMRVSVCNWQTSAADVERVIRTVAALL
jgi:glutamate/tyrosine decarboxylase-like PLP-dependent enzyme